MNFSSGKPLVLLHSLLLIAPGLGWQALQSGQATANPRGTTAIAQATLLVPANQRQKVAEQFLDLVFSQQYAKATEYISSSIKDEFPASVIQQKAIAFQTQNGAFIKRLKSELDGDVVVVNLLFKNNPKSIIISFDKDLKILNADYFIQPANSPSSTQTTSPLNSPIKSPVNSPTISPIKSPTSLPTVPPTNLPLNSPIK